MRVLKNRKPNVKALARKGDVEGLINAASYSELVAGPEGGAALDVGAPIRMEALRALDDVAPDRAREVLVSALGDSSERVRTAAVMALYERKDSEQLVQAAARLQAGRLRATAVQALFKLHPDGSSKCLADALVRRQDDRPLDEDDQALVLGLIQAEERPEAVEEVVHVLISALDSRWEIVADRAEALLVRLGSRSVEPLIRELENGATPQRAAAVLAEINDARALESLVAAVSHPDVRVRSHSCSALGKLRDPAAIEPLLQATRDPEHTVRVLAAAALDRMGTAAVAVTVAALLRPALSEALAGGSLLRMQTSHRGRESTDGYAAASLATDMPDPGRRWRLSYQAVPLRLLRHGGQADSNGPASDAISLEGRNAAIERSELSEEGDVAAAE